MAASSVRSVVDRLAQMPQLSLVMRELEGLLAGEQQHRQEFYETMTEDGKMEFINGQVVFHSPVKSRHGKASDYLFSLLFNFVLKHDLGRVGHESMLVSLTRNDYEPDIAYWSQAQAAQFDPGQMRFPAPDLVVEVLSPSTEQTDHEIKFNDYEAHGVSEYWLIDPETETVEQYALRAGQYALLMKSATGTLNAVAVAGFSIPVRAIFDADANLLALNAILQ